MRRKIRITGTIDEILAQKAAIGGTVVGEWGNRVVRLFRADPGDGQHVREWHLSREEWDVLDNLDGIDYEVMAFEAKQ